MNGLVARMDGFAGKSCRNACVEDGAVRAPGSRSRSQDKLSAVDSGLMAGPVARPRLIKPRLMPQKRLVDIRDWLPPDFGAVG